MATVHDVQNEISGAGNHHAVPIWRNVKGWAASPRSLQDKVTRLLREWTEQATTLYDWGKPGDPARSPVGPRNALYRVLHEATLWLPRLDLGSLKAKRGQTDTVLGHARDAASYGDILDQKLDRIAAALDVDLSDIK